MSDRSINVIPPRDTLAKGVKSHGSSSGGLADVKKARLSLLPSKKETNRKSWAAPGGPIAIGHTQSAAASISSGSKSPPGVGSNIGSNKSYLEVSTSSTGSQPNKRMSMSQTVTSPTSSTGSLDIAKRASQLRPSILGGAVGNRPSMLQTIVGGAFGTGIRFSNNSDQDSDDDEMSDGSHSQAMSRPNAPQMSMRAVAINPDIRRRGNKKGIKGRIFSLVMSRAFEFAMSMVIVLHTILVALEAERRAEEKNDDVPEWLAVSDRCFLVIYCLELVLRAIACGRHFCASHWNLFDLLCVICGILGELLSSLGRRSASALQLLRTFRAIRVLRVLRVVIAFKPLYLLLATLTTCLHTLFWSSILLFAVLVIVSLVAMEIIRPELETAAAQGKFKEGSEHGIVDAFCNLHHSIITFFGFMTLHSWDKVMLPTMIELPWTTPIFIAFILLTTYGILNLVTANVVEAVLSFAQADEELSKKRLHDKKKFAQQQLLKTFKELDSDGTGCITWQEFMHNRGKDGQFNKIMDLLGLDEAKLGLLWQLLDQEGTGEVSYEDFVETMWQIQSDEQTWTLMRMYNLQRRMLTKIEESTRLTRKASMAQVPGSRVSQSLPSSSVPSRMGSQIIQEDLLTSGTGELHALCENDDDLTHSGNLLGSIEDEVGEPLSPRPFSPAPVVSPSGSYCQPDDVVEAEEFMRSLPLRYVAATTDDALDFWEGNTDAERVWKSGVKESDLGQPCQRCDFFVSHCWRAPDDWYSIFRKGESIESYHYLKAQELNNIYLTKRSKQKDNEFFCWVDKVCIPQHDPILRSKCVNLIEDFLQRCDGMIVLMSWNYFSRLWCIYEWACFLVAHNFTKVELGCDSSLRRNATETLPKFIEAVEAISVVQAQCYNQEDHAVLEGKVYKYYAGSDNEESFKSFERFAKVTAIALMSKSIILWRARGEDGQEWLQPLVRAAARMGFDSLEEALKRADPQRWWEEDCDKSMSDYKRVVFDWFHRRIMPVLMSERKVAVRPDYLRKDSIVGDGTLKNSESFGMRKVMSNAFGDDSYNNGADFNDSNSHRSMFHTLTNKSLKSAVSHTMSQRKGMFSAKDKLRESITKIFSMQRKTTRSSTAPSRTSTMSKAGSASLGAGQESGS